MSQNPNMNLHLLIRFRFFKDLKTYFKLKQGLLSQEPLYYGCHGCKAPTNF